MKDYIENVVKTESEVTPELIARMSDKSNIRLLHAGIGMCTELVNLSTNLRNIYFMADL